MSSLRTTLLVSAGALACALVFEGLFQLLPVSGSSATGYHLDELVLSYPPHHHFRSSSGWDLRHPQRLQANNAGFVTDTDFQPDPQAVAFIGDSFIEASALDEADRPAARLRHQMGGRRAVYALGAPGTSLLDHAERVRLAAERWQVQDMVVLVALGDVRQSICGSGQIAGPCLNATSGQFDLERRPEAGPLKRWLRHSALAQYLFSQLKVAPERLVPTLRALPASLVPGRHAAPISPPARVTAGPDPQLLQQIGQRFFERIRPFVKGRLVILIDRPLPGRDSQSLPLADSDRFAAMAIAHGATVVDMAPIYAEHARGAILSLAVSPDDGHHNALGAELLARAAALGLGRAGPWTDAEAAR
ncbi:hypothetical protein BurJ1DRAFT_4651 [Burkholderiales bacterium JOSHI_001]|nr:hypothetical protein BurJ1DRAFT_4651 [Burkholderiales bacterium JOSHI_001]